MGVVGFLEYAKGKNKQLTLVFHPSERAGVD